MIIKCLVCIYLIIKKEKLFLQNDYSKLHIFENKNEFNEVFGDYLKRKWMFINRKNYNEFECFIKNMDYIIAKPNDNTEGKRIEKIKYL